MVDYYKNKKDAFDMIDKLVTKDGMPVKNIVFLIESKFGIGEKTVMKHIQGLKEFGLMNVVDGFIVTQKEEVDDAKTQDKSKSDNNNQ
jgi:hypothetical protein